MGLLSRLAFMHGRIGIAAALCLGLLLTALWGYSLYRCLRGPHDQGPLVGPADGAPLDDLTWALLIVLTGWFGALAYFAVVLLPRLTAARRRFLLLHH